MNGRLIARSEVDARLASRMLRLFRRHFVGVEPGTFLADLREKRWVLLLEEGGRLAGFSTLDVYGARHDGRRITVVYSGDTIVDPAGWRCATLPRAWVRAVRGLHARCDHGPLWWLLLVSGFRTYRFLPVFCRDFHPRPDGRSGTVRALAHGLARQRFGDRYDAARGIVRFDRPQRLREGLCEVPEGRRADPHVAFFLQANPGHAQGDELVCAADLSDANLTAAGLRMLYGPRRVSPPARAAGV